MGFFNDYATATEEYVDTYVELEIINVTYDGEKLNAGDKGQFDVRITNTGPVDMLDVDIKFTGLHGTLVKGSGALMAFGPYWVYNGVIKKIGSHGNNSSVLLGNSANGSDFSQILYFQAPDTPLPKTGLVEVSINNWIADLGHIHYAHSREGASGMLELRVFPAP